MIITSAEYKNAVAADAREIKLKAIISGVEVTGEYLIGAAVEEVINAGSELSMGCACSSKLTLEMRMPEPAVALNGASIGLYGGIIVNGAVEWVPLGVYYVSDITTSTNYQTVTITAYDGMGRLGDPYITTITQWPAEINDIVEDICDQNGLTLAYGDWPEYTIPDEAYDAQYTCREMLGFIAGMMGKNARFNRGGELTFCWYTDCDTEITRALQYQNGLERLLPEAITITSVTTGTKDNVIVSGSGRGIEFSNPFIDQDMADAILTQVYGFTYAPAKLKWRGNPALEAGDIVTVETQSGETLAVPVMQQKIVIAGGMYGEITAPGSAAAQIAMDKSPSAVKLERVYAGLTEAFREATKKISGASGGYFKIETDELGFPSGWVITDDTGTKLWKFNDMGLAWSGDGGATYSNIAITMDGQISANAITAGSLSAERIAVENYGGEDEATLENYIHFENGNIILGKTGNDLVLKIGYEENPENPEEKYPRISFITGYGTDGEKAVAYFSNNSLEIADVGKIQFGNFGYIPRKNGNLSFTKVVS